MKLLFDQNLSFKLCQTLADIFPGSSQVGLVGLAKAEDRALWQHAKDNAFVLVTQDADFADMAALYGQPPKVIWLRCGKWKPAKSGYREASPRPRPSNRCLRAGPRRRLLGDPVTSTSG